MRALPTASTRHITFPEFERLISALSRGVNTVGGAGVNTVGVPAPAPAGMVMPSAIQMRRTFDLYDQNRSGQLEFRELRQVLGKLGLTADSATVLDTLRCEALQREREREREEREKFVCIYMNIFINIYIYIGSCL